MIEPEIIKQKADEIGRRRMTSTLVAIDQRNRIVPQPIFDNTATYKMWLYGQMSHCFIDSGDIEPVRQRVEKILETLAEEEIMSEKADLN